MTFAGQLDNQLRLLVTPFLRKPMWHLLLVTTWDKGTREKIKRLSELRVIQWSNKFDLCQFGRKEPACHWMTWWHTASHTPQVCSLLKDLSKPTRHMSIFWAPSIDHEQKKRKLKSSRNRILTKNSVMVTCLSTWNKLGSSGRKEHELRKCLP